MTWTGKVSEQIYELFVTGNPECAGIGRDHVLN